MTETSAKGEQPTREQWNTAWELCNIRHDSRFRFEDRNCSSCTPIAHALVKEFAAAFARGAGQARALDVKALEIMSDARDALHEHHASKNEIEEAGRQAQLREEITDLAIALSKMPLPQPAQDWLDSDRAESFASGIAQGMAVQTEMMNKVLTRKLADAEAKAYRRCAELADTMPLTGVVNRKFLAKKCRDWAEAATGRVKGDSD